MPLTARLIAPRRRLWWGPLLEPYAGHRASHRTTHASPDRREPEYGTHLRHRVYPEPAAGSDRVDLAPSFGQQLLEDARHQTFQIREGPLLRSPASWQPGELRRVVACLELDDQTDEAVRLLETNQRLRRLGFNANLQPVPAARATSDPSASKVVHTPGAILRRPGIGQVIGVR